MVAKPWADDVWTRPVIASTVTVPTIAACVDLDGARAHLEAEITATATSYGSASGEIRVQTLDNSLGTDDAVRILIDPGTESTATFLLGCGATGHRYLAAPDGRSRTVHTIPFVRRPAAGAVDHLRWSYAGYAGTGVRITVLHGDRTLAGWIAPGRRR